MHGLILAGGEGTRLGPLGLQRSKAAVSVGGQPMVVRQYQQLKSIGCNEVTVVVSSRTQDQVVSIANSAGLPIRFCVQSANHPYAGPTTAIAAANLHRISDDETVMLFADTYLETCDIPIMSSQAAVAPAPTSRSFCTGYPDGWCDRVVDVGELVAVGAFCLNTAKMARVASLCETMKERNMGDFLKYYSTLEAIDEWEVTSWMDAGDIPSLEKLNQAHFISRSFNKITLDGKGALIKRGDVKDEITALAEAPTRVMEFYPRVYTVPTHDAYARREYRMEYVPLPTLAELYLYWPKEESMWRHITKRLLDRLAADHWPAATGLVQFRAHARELHARAENMYVKNVAQRYYDPKRWPAPHTAKNLKVNGEKMPSGVDLLWLANKVGDSLPHYSVAAYLHGDPNFTNVLWSLETSTFRLIDPRGTWGGPTSVGDRAYDVAKIAYSPIFSRVAHGLFEIKSQGDEYATTPLTLDPIIMSECEAFSSAERLRKICALMLLAGAPLHEGDEATIMYLTASQMLQEWA